MKANFISVSVFSNPLGDCTLGGTTSNNRSLYLFRPYITDDQILYICEKEGIDKDKCLRVVRHSISYNYAEVVFKRQAKEGTYMAGGNFVYSCDSRYKDVSGISYPISVHDRFETWEQYEMYSR